MKRTIRLTRIALLLPPTLLILGCIAICDPAYAREIVRRNWEAAQYANN